jgi:LysM repeat protein
MSRRFKGSMFLRIAAGLLLAVAAGTLAFAQTGDFSESNIPASAPTAKRAAPSEGQAQEEAPEGSATEEGAEAAPPVVHPQPARVIPYTVRPGDNIGAIASMFGVTPEEIAHANRISVDDELQVDEVLRIPKPFTNEVNSLRSQVDSLNAQLQATQQKSDAAENQLQQLKDQVQELQGDNQNLQSSVKQLPWWQATSFTMGLLALVMFVAMIVTLFEWWRMRRKFLALAEMTEALSRLDYKYRAMFAKAELRLQQLYGRRRQGFAEGQVRPKLPEEMEIDRLNEELKQVLAEHLEKLGARLHGSRKRGRWREMLGGVDSPVEARVRR